MVINLRLQSPVYLIFILLLLLHSAIFAQTTWTRYFGNLYLNDEAYSCLQTKDNNFLVIGDTGNSGTPYMIKYSLSRDVLWTKAFISFPQIGYNAAEDPSGNLYFNSGNGITKTDQFGMILWRKFFPDTVSSMYINMTSDNQNLVCFGYNSISLSDTSGNRIWSHTFNDTHYISYHINEFIQINNGLIFSGIKETPGGYSGFLWKYDLNGNLMWQKTYNAMQIINSIAVNSDLTFLTVGLKNYFMFTAKYDIYGNQLWEKNYIEDSLRSGNSIKKAGNNRFVIASNNNKFQGKCLIIDSTGNIVSSIDHEYGLNDWVDYRNVISVSDSGFVFTGIIEFDENGPVDWIVVKTDKYGNTTPIGIEPVSSQVPDQLKLYQNYPNPFNPETKIRFEIPANRNMFSANIRFYVYDITGRVIYKLYDNKPAGVYEISFNASDLASGIYFYTIESGGMKQMKKMILLK